MFRKGGSGHAFKMVECQKVKSRKRCQGRGVREGGVPGDLVVEAGDADVADDQLALSAGAHERT